MTYDEAREKAASDLWFLITEILCFDRYYEPLHRPLCEQIMRAPTVSVWLLPRDHLKTTTLSVAAAIQSMIIDVNVRILISTHLIRATMTVVDQIRTLLTKCERLVYLFPELALPREGRDRGRREEFSVPGRTNWGRKETTVSAAAVDASMVSRHFDRMFVDDLQTDRNSKTAEALQAVRDHWQSLWPMLEPDGGKMYIPGTRWDQDDLYAYILERCSDIGAYVCVRRALERRDGKPNPDPIFPRTDSGKVIFTRAILRQRRKMMGDYQFSCQFMNDPIPDAETRILHPKQVIYTESIPNGAFRFILIDPAISTKETADRCAILVVATDYMKNIYVERVVAGNMMPAEAARWIYELTNEYMPKEIFCESNAWQTLYMSYIERLVADYGQKCYITEIPRKAGETAISRILGLQPHFEQGRIQFLAGAPGIEDAIKELISWTKRRARQGRDDICSALSDAPHECWYPGASMPSSNWSIDEHWTEMKALDMKTSGIGGHVIPSVSIGK